MEISWVRQPITKKKQKGIDFPFPKLFGKLADVIIERNTEIKEARIMQSLAEISHINYSNAKKNNKAQTRSWFMDQNHTNKRGNNFNIAVGGRLCISDCSQVTDGASILALANSKYTKEYAKKTNRPEKDFALLKGWGHRVAPIRFAKKQKNRKAKTLFYLGLGRLS